jgi:hypothetical protein
MAPQEGYEVSESSFQDTVDMAKTAAEVALPSWTMTETSSTDDLFQIVSSSASSLASFARIRNERDPRSAERGQQQQQRQRPPWFQHGLPQPSSSSRQPSSCRKAQPGRSLADLFSIVARDFFQNYSCTHPSPFVVVPPGSSSSSNTRTRSAPAQHQQQRDDAPSEAEEIEFDEDEILRRDYELSRV